jgi:hypothetical protein
MQHCASRKSAKCPQFLPFAQIETSLRAEKQTHIDKQIGPQ